MPPLEERTEYAYQNIRTKNYQWGDGDKVGPISSDCLCNDALTILICLQTILYVLFREAHSWTFLQTPSTSFDDVGRQTNCF